MKLIFQTDKEFDDQKSAHSWCYFLSLNFHLALWFDPKRFTHEQMEADFDYYIKSPEADVEEDGTVTGAQLVCDHVVPGKVKYLGKFGPEMNIGPKQFAIGVFQREFKPDEKPFVHFVAINNYKKVIYDPWSSEGSRSVREGKLIGIRLFEVQ